MKKKGFLYATGVFFLLILLGAVSFLKSALATSRANSLVGDDTLQTGELIPTGVRITPTAATGSTFQPLHPDLPGDPSFIVGQAVTTAISPDGKTLLILTSGFNSESAGPTHPRESNEYIFVYDLSGVTPFKQQVLQIPNPFDGLVWNPNGAEFYATGGPNDNVHFFDKGIAGWAESGTPVALGHMQAIALGTITPGAMGIASTADGSRYSASTT